MMQRHPNFRHAQRNRRPFHKRPAKSAMTGRFGWRVLCLSVATALAAWDATPRLIAWGTTPQSPVAQTPADETAVFYAGCSDVRAAGRAPLYAGQPGYRSGMDGDGDGIACEAPH